MGLKEAKGQYFKVVDSDDWLETDNLKKLLEQLKQWHKSNTRVDLVICNYVYDHLFENKTKSMSYENVFKKNTVMTWDDIGRFSPSQYIIMHSAMFRTDVLRKSGVVLPEHTFYVDNIFTHQPLSYTENLYYMNMDLYHYFIGREDQSVNEKVLMKRIDQQIRVAKMVLYRVVTEQERNAPKKLRKHLLRNLSILLSISDIHLLMIGTEDAVMKRKDLWDCVKKSDKKLYRYLKYRTTGGYTYLPLGKFGDKLTMLGYRAAQKLYKFN